MAKDKSKCVLGNTIFIFHPLNEVEIKNVLPLSRFFFGFNEIKNEDVAGMMGT